jgi:hypothetical protein
MSRLSSLSQIILFAAIFGLATSCQKDQEDIVPDGKSTVEDGKSVSPGVTTVQANYFKNLFNLFGDGWTGGDGAYSIPLPDERLLWTFGDSFLGTVNPDYSRSGPLVNNLFVVQDGDNLTTLMGGTSEDPEAFVTPWNNPSHWYWPGDGIVIEDQLYVFMLRVRSTGEAGVFGFETVGTDMAVFSLPDLELVEQYAVARSYKYLMGVSLFREDDFVYVYGTQSSLGKAALAARFNVNDPETITYWNGTDWGDEFVGDAYMTRDNGENLFVSNQFKVFKWNDNYRLLVQDDFFRSAIRVYRSDSPTGPWSNPITIYNTPETGEDGGNIFTYNAFAHPHIIDPDKGMLVTYSVNTFDFFSLFQDARLYRPRFLWVKPS